MSFTQFRERLRERANRPGLLFGIGSVLDLQGANGADIPFGNPADDTAALAGDLQRVGRDMWVALERCNREQEESAAPASARPLPTSP